MSTAATIVFAREDLSIPGAVGPAAAEQAGSGAVQARFFDLVERSDPDVIVLDLSRQPAAGTETILEIRQRTQIPILVVCGPEQLQIEDYRAAGATDWVSVPIDIVGLNRSIQRIMRVRGRESSRPRRIPGNFRFAGMTFCPSRNLLCGTEAPKIDLTTSEAHLLTHLLSRPWVVCARSEIAELLNGPGHSVGDRAIDVLVTRLRKKLVLAGGIGAEQLIKTEFRRGYMLVADVSALARDASSRPSAGVQP